MKTFGIIAAIALASLLIIGGFMYGIPVYNVWQQEMSGKAEMAKAEQNRKILVEEAKAKLEAEKLNAQAEVERAKGMAEAMKVENGTLNSTYNQYLFIDNSDENLSKFEKSARNMHSLARYSRANQINKEGIEKYLNEAHS